MAKRRRPMTWAQHAALGRELKAMRDRLQEMVIDLNRDHFPAASPVITCAARAERAIGGLRSSLDAVACDQFRGDEEDPTGLYYGK